MKVRSPLTNTYNVKLLKTIPVSEIVKTYKSESSVDTSRIFGELENIHIYKCLDTDFLFYYPLNIAGDGSFYEELEKISWYYMDWKWEHENALKYMRPQNEVLEIGCAKGSFVKELKKKEYWSYGIRAE
ncbi:MAG TPA: hypothetical protein VK783_06065 [Bacteroidia bacterium]|jgi:hypothetical protein|nr:hypothetical protein [Bacteroidia bacterium]